MSAGDASNSLPAFLLGLLFVLPQLLWRADLRRWAIACVPIVGGASVYLMSYRFDDSVATRSSWLIGFLVAMLLGQGQPFRRSGRHTTEQDPIGGTDLGHYR